MHWQMNCMQYALQTWMGQIIQQKLFSNTLANVWRYVYNMPDNHLLAGQSVEIYVNDPEADYGTETKALRLQIYHVGETVFIDRNDRCFCGSKKKKTLPAHQRHLHAA